MLAGMHYISSGGGQGLSEEAMALAGGYQSRQSLMLAAAEGESRNRMGAMTPLKRIETGMG